MHLRIEGRSRATRARSGISLLVVLLSLCGVAIVAMLAIPAFFERADFTLNNACDLLRRDVHSAQNRATFLRTEARFVFDADGWQALDMSGAPLGGTIDDHPIVRRFSVDGVFEGVSADHIAMGSGHELLISSRGTVLTGGTLVLHFRGEERRVEIERGTGQVLFETSGDEASR